MNLTERQEKLLNTLIKDYINTAKPISSKHLQKRYDLDVCSATVRGEMQKLTKEGYLTQPHTSSGRVPTNKGYRFFVDSFLEEDSRGNSCPSLKELREAEKDIFRFAELITKTLADNSCNLVMSCLLKKGLVWEDGWEEIFQIPEFEEKSFRDSFVKEVKSLEKKFEELSDLPNEVSVYIGREESMLNSKDVSLIITKGRFPDQEEGMIAVLGPNRMPYDRNISTMNSLITLFEDF